MPNIKSAKKRVLTSERRRLRNRAYRSSMKTSIKRFEQSLETGDIEEIKSKFSEAYRLVDKAAAKGVIHKNTAARQKSRMNKKFNKITAS
ncbi:MAG: 30S ribosomal protein S20 [Clostridia bacterium]|nr:30S ribosomal protein S20 [Clostridia bacterium]